MSRPLTQVAQLSIHGAIAKPDDISGVACVGDSLLIVSDETARVEVLEQTDEGFTVREPIVLGKSKDELDLEAVAVDGDTVYVVGSHAKVRPRIQDDDSYAAASKKIATITDSGKCDRLFRFSLTREGTATDLERASLRKAIRRNPVLAPFAELPGKENGIDIEGLAVRDGKLYVGFRGPVLRDNYVPVLVTKFGKSKGELTFVRLGGLGIRCLASVADGFLILAGPPGDGPGSFQIFHWNGHDCLPGAEPAGVCESLCDVVAETDQKPEGFAVRQEDADGYDLLRVCDGVPNGNPTAYRLARAKS
jgi:hypothetical protein